jgi:hypothetical protein
MTGKAINTKSNLLLNTNFMFGCVLVSTMSLVYRLFKQFSPTSLVLIINLILYLPLAILQRPLWDGALSSYARRGSYKYLNSEAIDYSFPTQYYPEIFINYFALKTHLNFFIYYWLVLSIVLSLLYKSLQKLSFLLKLNSLNSIQSNKRSAIAFAFFPAFHVLFSTQNFIWIICLALCLWGTIFLFSNHYKVKILGVFFILFSFQMASLPFLFLIFFSALFRHRKKLEILKVFLATAFLCTLFLTIFRKFLFHPAGIYENYNSVTFESKTLPIVLQNVFNFAIFVVPIVIIYALVTTYDLSKNNVIDMFRSNKNIIVWLFIMLLFCISPYVLALKSPSRLDLFDWSYRHGIITVVPLLLYIFWASDRHEGVLNKVSILKSIAIVFALVISSVTAAYGHVQSTVFDKGLILQLSTSVESWERSDLLCFDFESRRLNFPRFYELNEMVWQVTGNNVIQSDTSGNCSIGELEDLNYFSNSSVLDISESKWQNIYIGGVNSESKQKLVITGSVGLKEVFQGVFFSKFDFFSLKFFEFDDSVN